MIMLTKKIFVPILFVLISFVCNSQSITPPMPIPPPAPGLPIDAGILLGACFAMAYGAKKLLKNH